MDINIILEYFNELNDKNAMVVEFKNGNYLLIDNNDVLHVKGDLIEIKTENGRYITNHKNITGLKTLNRSDLIRKVIFKDILSEMGDA